MKQKIPAVVIGSCSHALAICRSLGRKGVPTFLVQEKRNMPVSKTRYAKSIYVSAINTDELIPNLIKISDRFSEKPVLFPTNDNMVRLIALHYEKIKKCYRLNWPDPEVLLKLIDKKYLPTFIEKANLSYPKTLSISNKGSLSYLKHQLQYPLILKPSKPLSAFKVKKICCEEELIRELKLYENQIKDFILQEWIPGGDRTIYFVNLYFDNNCKPIAHFIGRRIRAFPKGLGAACSTEGVEGRELLDITQKFFSTVSMRGPAALELKEGPDRRFYVIEPTVGRTEFLVLTCIRNGVDIPYIAYTHQIGQYPICPKQNNRVIWIDLTKDFPMVVESLKNKSERKETFRLLFRKMTFAFWAWDDPLPTLYNIAVRFTQAMLSVNFFFQKLIKRKYF